MKLFMNYSRVYDAIDGLIGWIVFKGETRIR